MNATNTDDLDTLSAIWILACNDETSIITYRSIFSRLGIKDSASVKSLIAKRGELFRQGVRKEHLDEWKRKMRAGHHLPSWVRATPEAEREAAIESIDIVDCFRSQFRGLPWAEKSPIEVISWGLEHLDRLRKGRDASKDIAIKRWQIWLVFWVGIINLLVQVFLAWGKVQGWLK